VTERVIESERFRESDSVAERGRERESARESAREKISKKQGDYISTIREQHYVSEPLETKYSNFDC